MEKYYSEKLFAHRLQQCYQIASPRVKQYLQAEIDHVIRRIPCGAQVLELGCGYGRIIPALSSVAGRIIGIDTSLSSIRYGKSYLQNISNYLLLPMNAVSLAFRDHSFDGVVCIQNGISAFQVDRKNLIRESIRVTRTAGIILFSSYSPKFWEHRLEWFRKQSETGLLGEIDLQKTGNGVIVGKDGFTATTLGKSEFLDLVSDLPVTCRFTEVDESSLFCEMAPI